MECQASSITYREAIERLSKHTPGHGIAKYNDHPKTTKRDILHLYDKAIIDERSQ
jgi:hypothetical protein